MVGKDLRKLPSDEEEGRLIRSSDWSAATAEDWPGDFFFLWIVTLVIGNVRFLPVATSVRDGALWPILGLSANRA